MSIIDPGCESKECFETKDLAEMVARRMRRSRREGRRISVYRCRSCRAWHVGERSPGSKRCYD